MTTPITRGAHARSICRRGRPPIAHDSSLVQRALAGYYCATEFCEEHRNADDIFSGILELKTEGDTSTRPLSRQQLFHILQWCPTITVSSVDQATNGVYARQTLERYAALGRVASKALERFIKTKPYQARREMAVKEAKESLDAPYLQELKAMGLV